MDKIQVNVHAVVNSRSIRREVYNGAEHIVIPSFTLPANVVMNNILYPSAEIDAHYKGLEGTFAPIGHPTSNGKFISASSPEALTNPHGNAGVWNRNVKKDGNRIYSEKWVNTEFAASTPAGKRLLERVAQFENGDNSQPIHTSVALYIEKEAADGTDGYDWIARIKAIDHDAILLDEPGAAQPSDGVGLMVNSANAVPLKVNSGVLAGESFRDKERKLEAAAKSRFVLNDYDYAYIADFTDSQAVIIRTNGVYEVFGYKIESGKIIFDDQGEPVERRESWVMKINQRLRSFFANNSPVVPAATKEVTEMPMTPEEKTELQALIANSVATANKGIVDAITAQGAQIAGITASLEANAKAADVAKRADVAKVYGEVVANALSGEALAVMHASLAPADTNTAAALAANSGAAAKPAAPKFDGLPD